MVTIAGTHQGKTKFVIPNEVVREQLFRYLLDTYKENDLKYDSYEKGKLESAWHIVENGNRILNISQTVCINIHPNETIRRENISCMDSRLP